MFIRIGSVGAAGFWFHFLCRALFSMTKLANLIPHSGICGVCGQQTLLTKMCLLTKIKVGKCCVNAMEFADKILEAGMAIGGPRHPDPGDFEPPH